MDNKEEREIREYGIYGMRIRVPNPEKAAGWLCENLFFKREEDEGENAVISGKFHLILKEEKHTKYKTELENGYLGFTHIALETGDIGEAIRYCLERGMILELGEKGGARYSGKVYGTGMTYFNIKTEFGIRLK